MARILIVDSDPKEAARVAKGLHQTGHACDVRRTGKEAIAAIEDQAYDLMLLDTMLPDGSGFEVCRHVRRNSELFHLPIVFFSIMSNPEEVQHGLAQGADDFISKPIDVPQLVQRLNSLVDASAQAAYIDPITGLADGEETRRRMQLRITRGTQFAVVYIELLGSRSLTKSNGIEARDRVFRHLSRALTLSGENLADGEFFTGHMGGGFFLSMLPVDETESYCTKILRGWRKHQRSLRESLGIEGDVREGPSDFLDLMICATARQDRDPCSAQDLLDTLSRIRRSVQEETGGIHLDRRHWAVASGTNAG